MVGLGYLGSLNVAKKIEDMKLKKQCMVAVYYAVFGCWYQEASEVNIDGLVFQMQKKIMKFWLNIITTPFVASKTPIPLISLAPFPHATP